jgi:hypothetical protein
MVSSATALSYAASNSVTANKAVVDITSTFVNVSAETSAKAISALNIKAASEASVLATENAILAAKAAKVAAENLAESVNLLKSGSRAVTHSKAIMLNTDTARFTFAEASKTALNAEALAAATAKNVSALAVENAKTEVVIQGGGVLGSIGSAIKDIFF